MRVRMTIGLAFALVTVSCAGRTNLAPGQICVEELENQMISEGPNHVTARMETYHPADHHNAVYRCGRHSIADGGTFFEELYQYRTIGAAQDEYTRQLEVFFFENEFTEPWQEPEFVADLDLAADEYKILCAERDSGTVLCGMVARYDNIVIRLNTNRTLTAMSLDDLELAIKSADAEFQ